ncbi:hypothetical protein [Sinirhodobacter huangdaonensis]|uniref:Uncharacterized protein n=1 Tax=Paenirhodobacter huangdaonensis TaxID=2501515 RepID=A0A3S3N749_9RHOB|nr:hypothetical protein [Sinirhodobacter huangdaonensis]RWR48024.1 hypothetical protein EOW66_18680 [Sinirhodobacter huangdaonensis]
MASTTVRLDPLSKITHRPKEAIRNIQKGKDAPWHDEEEFGDATQRRYTGFHALALVLAEMIGAQGCSVSLTGEFMRAHKSAINKFLDEIEGDLPPKPRFVLALQTAIEDEWVGITWQPMILCGYGSVEEVESAIAAEIAKVGRVIETRDGRVKDRVVGGPWIALASIPEAYRLLRQRAKAEGYMIEGRQIFKIADDIEGE